MDDLMKIDIYELLEISIDAEEKDIKKAYRKKALSCHPDKNPDNPKAAELFQQLTKALEILLDSKARAAYDKVLRAKKAAIVRNRELDSKRKKLKEDLEARERAAQDEKIGQMDAEKNLQKEIERLRKEGSKLIEEEQQHLKQEILRRNAEPVVTRCENLLRLKIKWNFRKNDAVNGDYTKDELKTILEKFGEIAGLVISSKKRGSGMVEFTTEIAARLALASKCGKEENPLILSLVSSEPNPQIPRPPSHSEPPQNLSTNYRDYESLVLMKLRQAEERKRLIQQMMEEDKVS